MSRWAKDEIEIAWALRRLGGTRIERNRDNALVVHGNDLPNIYFPGIKIGESVNLDDIINQNDLR